MRSDRLIHGSRLGSYRSLLPGVGALMVALAGLVGCESREARGIRESAPDHERAAHEVAAGVPFRKDVPREREECVAEGSVHYVAKNKDGVAGGEVSFLAPGTPRDILDLLLDFAGEATHRPWRTANRVLSSEQNRYRVEARYSGRMGIHPTVVLLYEVMPRDRGYVVSFRVDQAGFGLSRFEGQYEVEPLDETCSRLRETVFIDSGLPLVNASAEDIRAALHEDAKSIRAWSRERMSTEVALR